MKVIDLLNKIANGEEVPEKIKHNYETYVFKDNDYLIIGIKDLLAFLNDEIEIIEEVKKIENIKWNEKSSYNTAKEEIPMLMSRTEQLKKTLSEIIDYINKGDESE